MYNNWFLSFKITMGTMHMVISAAIASCAKYIAGYCKYSQRQKSQIAFSTFTITYKIIKALIILFSGQRILKTKEEKKKKDEHHSQLILIFTNQSFIYSSSLPTFQNE